MAEEIKKQLDRIERYSLLAAKKVLVLDDVSLLTGLSKSYLYKLTYSHQIPHYKNAKIIYFDRAEIEAWMKQNKVETNEELEQRIAANIVSSRIQKGGIR